jgi:type VII secretion-associated protein (TIGR03931 family)
VSEHRVIIEAGPGMIRRLCCATGTVVDDEMSDTMRAALDAIDDQVALVGERPVPVDSLWETALRSVTCASSEGMVIVHPSWWSPSRVGVVTAAAAAVAGDVLARPRSWLLMRASRAGPEETALVEIADRLAVIAGTEVTEAIAIPRNGEPQSVADGVAGVIAGMAPATVLIDTPGRVAGASRLAALIADAVRGGGILKTLEIDDVRLSRLAQSALPARGAPSGSARTAPAAVVRSRVRTLSGLGAAAIVVAAAAPALVTVHATDGRHREAITKQVVTAPTTFLVEGRVALAVPANWPTQRVVAGPGSARVRVASPADPEVALHITQSPVAGETLSDTAEQLKRAIDAAPGGVFVDFNPAATSAGRSAVTYREVRPTHQVRWTVLLEGRVRISIGCQSRPEDEEAVRNVCEQAVRSAHAIG